MYFYRKQVVIPIYKAFFVIILTNDIEKLNRLTNAEFDNNFTSYTLKYENPTSIYMLFDLLNFTACEHGLIAHEASHCSGILFDECKAKPDFDNDEHFAYMTDWFTQQCYNFIYSIITKSNFFAERYKNYLKQLLEVNPYKKPFFDIFDLFKYLHK
jgi:hypothetical protein